METQQLVELRKQMILEGEELHGFVRTEQALAREERGLIREDAKAEKERMDANAEKERIDAMEDAERIRTHEEDMFHLPIEADGIRR